MGPLSQLRQKITAIKYSTKGIKKPKSLVPSSNFLHKKKHPQKLKPKFFLPTPCLVLGLPGADSLGEEVIKPYTPITLNSEVGYFELVVKIYPKGRKSHHFREMRVGDYLHVQGPKLTRTILENPKDKTNVHLIYANVTLEDILLKKELDDFASKFPKRFKVYYVLNQPPVAWNGGTGFMSKEIIQSFFPAPRHHPRYKGWFLKKIIYLEAKVRPTSHEQGHGPMATHLNALGYKSEMQFEF
ncbi:NADH--cytochrome b5 reductase 1-like [Fagus crenata]